MSGIATNYIDFNELELDELDDLSDITYSDDDDDLQGLDQPLPIDSVEDQNVTTSDVIKQDLTNNQQGTATLSRELLSSVKAMSHQSAEEARTVSEVDDSADHRYLLVDMSHLIHKYEYGMMTNLSAKVEISKAVFGFEVFDETGISEGILSEEKMVELYGGGVSRLMTTTDTKPIPGTNKTCRKHVQEPAQYKEMVTKVPDGILKAIARWSRYGKDTVVMCGDRGGLISRKTLFSELYPGSSAGKSTGYKANRPSMVDKKLPTESIDIMNRVLAEAGIPSVFRLDYEADDYIFSLIQKIKSEDTTTPIDVVTNDADLLPLVDDQVSVFFQNRKTTYPTKGALSKRKYVMVTPENYSNVVEDISSFRNIKSGIPYNLFLLVKMLRGDKSDEIPQVKGMTPTRVSQIIEDIKHRYGDERIGEIFRYGTDPYVMYKTLLPFLAEFSGLTAIQEIQQSIVQEKYEEAQAQGTADGMSLEEFSKSVELVNIFDENWDIKEEYEAIIHQHTSGTGKDGYGGLLDISFAIKNYMLMDLNSSLNGKREQLIPKRLPARYDIHKLVSAANRVFSSQIPLR